MNKIFKFSRILAIAKKELMHILRDPFTIGLALGIPIIFTVFFGFAIDFDYRGIKMAVFDFDNSRQSREVAETFRASGYYKVFPGQNPGNPLLDVESERAFTALIINPEFARKVVAGTGGKLQMLIDGTDNNKTSVVSGYMAGFFDSVLRRLTGQGAKTPVSFETKFLFNPELNTKWFVVPGLIVVIIGLLSILMTSLTVAREWENGSMELLLSTPIKPLEIVIGKIIPYVVFVFFGIFLDLSACESGLWRTFFRKQPSFLGRLSYIYPYFSFGRFAHFGYNEAAAESDAVFDGGRASAFFYFIRFYFSGREHAGLF